MAGLPPTVQHAGFLVPNAGDVADPKMSEPDRIDFNTLGNAQWGVIEGCQVSVTGTTATIGADGTAIVNGQLVRVKVGTGASLGSGGSQDRFDLIATDLNGTLVVVPGTPSADPVFPDPNDNQTVLAAVLCKAGSSDFAAFVMDKRNFLRDSILTRLPDPTKPLIRNIALDNSGNGTGTGTKDLFSIDGNGVHAWQSDTYLYRSAPNTLEISSDLTVDNDLSVGNAITADSLTAYDRVNGSNLQTGTTLPGSANNGDIFQQESTGRVYVWTNAHWEELVTASGAVPVGAIITSLQAPVVMVPLGWIPLDGSTVPESAGTPALFSIPSLQQYITGTAPNRVLTTPNATKRVLIADFAAGAGKIGGNSQVVLSPTQMPQHKHNVATIAAGGHNHATGGSAGSTSLAGRHAHDIAPGTGTHTHSITDNGHRHAGMDLNGNQLQVIAVMWGGQNKIDALFNDRSHTYSVEAFLWTSLAPTGISINSAGSGHDHTISGAGDHTHPVSLTAAAGHTHPVTEDMQGGNTPVDVTGAYLTVFVYVRS